MVNIFMLHCNLEYDVQSNDDVEVWEDEEVEGDLFEISGPDSIKPHSLVMWCVYSLAGIQKRYRLPVVAISALLKFLSIFFIVLGQISPTVSDVFEHFPGTINQFEQMLESKGKYSFTM